MPYQFFTAGDDRYIVILVPHQMPVKATSHFDEADALAFYTESASDSGGAFEAWVSDAYEAGEDPWEAEPFRYTTRDGQEVVLAFCDLLWEWVAHDLHALYRYSLEEAREALARLDAPNPPNAAGAQKIHQHAAVAAVLRQFSLAAFQADIQVTFENTIRLRIGDDSRDESPETIEDNWGALEDVAGFAQLKKLHGEWLSAEIESALSSVRAGE